MNSFFFMWYKFSKNLVNQKFECSTNIKFSTGMYGDISCYKPKNQISTETTFILNPQKLVSMKIKNPQYSEAKTTNCCMCMYLCIFVYCVFLTFIMLIWFLFNPYLVRISMNPQSINQSNFVLNSNFGQHTEHWIVVYF